MPFVENHNGTKIVQFLIFPFSECVKFFFAQFPTLPRRQ